MGGGGHPSVMTAAGKYPLPFLVPFHPIIGLLEALDGEGNGNPLQYSCLENPWTEEPGRLQSWGR